MKKLVMALALVSLAVIVLCTLTNSLAASTASTVNSIAVAKLADALQMSQLLTACMSLLALMGGISLGAAGLAAILAIHQNRRQTGQLAHPNTSWGYSQHFMPDDTEFPPIPGLPRPHAGIVLLDELPADPDVGDNLFQNWMG